MKYDEVTKIVEDINIEIYEQLEDALPGIELITDGFYLILEFKGMRI